MELKPKDRIFFYYTLQVPEYSSNIAFRAKIEEVSKHHPRAVATEFKDLVRLFENSVKKHRRLKHLCLLRSKKLKKAYSVFEKDNGPFGYIHPQKIRTIIITGSKLKKNVKFVVREEFIEEAELGAIKSRFNSKAHVLHYVPSTLRV